MRILSVVGARPQFVKLAPIAAAVTAAGHEHVIVHTGQHYDPELSDVFFSGLGIPQPDEQLHVGSGPGHGVQTGAMLAALDPILATYAPDWVLVYGDTNSTIAGALSAVKLHLPLAHLEAGLRSFNRRMPEEHNRVLTDHAADLLLAPTAQAVEHLEREGLGERTVLVGDVMVDACLRARDLAAGSLEAPAPGVDPARPYLLATIHRAENTDERERLTSIIDALAGLPIPVALLAHPRLRARAAEYGIELDRGSLRAGAPLPYAQLVAAVSGSAGVVTDSGGLQKEAYILARPCTTVRTETEWVETLKDGWNVLTEPTAADFSRIATRPAPATPLGRPFGDGEAATRVVSELERAARSR
ncbi:UDP-N-acetylglucosamine 2-epimerase (non-hydrolyzing) [Actinospica sp. MGRD01-02]|uniref:UDP-N-acetylglucosamine 2-epimerase (Non-hydrolyzing) n=1 Tax=Actinospica acidithermotolerans TaxID=2828514 RepID=A0A941EB07_9ACTN|nr:UDP-N-acetylglucosamine 2-epimerase (non-hydrolyzing) [Actinospica acidithermotolerans]MBR7828241.1 UDP-N-acetylglucosamine 2-epimerase (non-hydrolyzing) [Actinospica acidithermotolerans]